MGFSKMTTDVLNISKLPNSVQGNAKDLKATFDKAGEDIKEAHNKLVDELAEQNAASNIGAISEEGATTVQAELDKLNDRIKVDFTELEIDIDDELDVESENAVKNKVIAKEIKGNLYAIDRKNSATIGVKELSNGLSNKNIFDDLIPFGFKNCQNAMVDIKASSISSESDSFKLINAFDDNASSYWYSDSTSLNQYIEMRFKEPIKINKVKMRIYVGSTSYFKQAKIVGSNDEITWTPLYTLTASQSAVEEVVLENTNYFSVYRIEYELTTKTAVSLYHVEITEWEGTHKVYCHNLSLPLSKYELGKKIAVQLSEQIFEEPNYIEEEFSENIIPDMSSATIENQYGKWEATANTGTAYYPFDRDDSTSLSMKSSSIYYAALKSIAADNGKYFAIKPKTIRVYGSNFGNTKIQGLRTDGYWETIGTLSNTDTSTKWNEITINTDKYYSGIKISWTCNNTGSYSYLYSFEITEGSIRYGKPLPTKLNTFQKPYLDINNLGVKTINETISANQLYVLIYNGEGWDVLRQFVCGTYTGDD